MKIAIFEQVIISTGKLKRGQVISNSDIVLQEVDISRLRGHSFTDVNDLIGTKLKTSIKSGQVIDSSIICLICAGDSVQITAINSQVDISAAGTALNDGGRGDKIRVQNNASRLILDAYITNSGIVKVAL